MFDFKSKIKRQIEILSLVIDVSKKERYTTFDLAAILKVENITIQRDLQDLRSYGIDIHSTKSKGVTIRGSLSDDIIKEIILHFMGLSYTEVSLDRSTQLLVKKFKEQALVHIVSLQHCIDKSLYVKICYNKEGSEINEDILLKPVTIFQNEGSWRLLADHNDVLKQYRIDKITEVQIQENSFKNNYEGKLKELFEYSFKTWIGEERYFVKIQFDETWTKRIQPRLFVPNQKMTEVNGKLVLEFTVNSLEEIAGWIVSRGEGCEVLEPKELRSKVIELASSVLENYKIEVK